MKKYIHFILILLCVFIIAFSGTVFFLQRSPRPLPVSDFPVLSVGQSTSIDDRIRPEHEKSAKENNTDTTTLSQSRPTTAQISKSTPAKKVVSPASLKTDITNLTQNIPTVTAVQKPGVNPTPPVLTVENTSGASAAPEALSPDDIFSLTNNERVAEGLARLSYNNRLSAMAEAKAVDMIQRHYFAHVSPEGVDIATLAEKYGYAYLTVGENLALGDFTSSADVIKGWMNSEGHRANILGKNYTELGVATVQGDYNGRAVWYVVQEFGSPLPNCPEPEPLLKQKIDIYQTEITALEQTLVNLKNELDSFTGDRAAYNAKVSDYNNIVELYNNLIVTAKQLIQQYNAEADAFNACMKA